MNIGKSHLKLLWKTTVWPLEAFKSPTEDLYLRETASKIKNGLICRCFRAFFLYLKGSHFPERLSVASVIFLINQVWHNISVSFKFWKFSFQIYFHRLAEFIFKRSGISRTVIVFWKMALSWLLSNNFLKNDIVIKVM